MRVLSRLWFCILLFAAANSPAQLTLAVDASDVARKILHAHMTIPATPGSMTLVYPKWIPGEHGPTGPITDLVGLHFSAGGKTIPWQRDLSDMYAFHLTVPEGANQIEADFDTVGNAEKAGFLLGYSTTASLTTLNWNQVLLYPAGAATDSVRISASLRLPQGWKFGTALPVKSQSNSFIQFIPVMITALVDSPVIAGSHFREVPITPPGEPRQHFLELAADSDAALAVPEDWIAAYRKVVQETGALFGARHYHNYHFLVSLHGTDMNGLEHHQSSDDRLPEFGLVNSDYRSVYGYLLTHEMTHSWNGKYRRPAGLATANYQDPMQGDLLWVYEGLTNHLGYLLAVRSGIWTQAIYRDQLAEIAHRAEHRSGRQWRPLEDTAAAAQLLYFAPAQWENWRRSVDYYQEGTLIWLEADTIIRKQSHGAKSLDDFCRAFYGGQSGPPKVIPYKFEDIVNALNGIAPYDWRTFFRKRIYDVAPQAPLGGITGSGWKLVYTEEPNAQEKSREIVLQTVDMTASLGMSIDADPDSAGNVIDVVEGSPASKADIGPGMRLIGVNGKKYSLQRLRSAVKEAKQPNVAIDLIVANGEDLFNVKIQYHGGEQYPHLERDTSRPDMLTSIADPLVK